MKVTKEKIENSQAFLTVEMEPAEVEEVEFEYLLLDDRYDREEWEEAKCRELNGFGWEEWRTIPWSGMRVGGVRVFARGKKVGPPAPSGPVVLEPGGTLLSYDDEVEPEPRNWVRCKKCGYVDRPRMYTEEEVLAQTIGKAEWVGRLWTEQELDERIRHTLTFDGAKAAARVLLGHGHEGKVLWTGTEIGGLIQQRLDTLLALWSTVRTGVPVADRQESWDDEAERLARATKLQAAIDEVVAVSKRPGEMRPDPVTRTAVVKLLWPLATKEE